MLALANCAILIVYDSVDPIPYETEFMMPRSEWDELVRTKYFDGKARDRLRQGGIIKTWVKETSYMAYYQFCMTNKILKNCDIQLKLLHRLNNNDDDPSPDRDIFIPHVDLEFVFDKYQKAAFMPLSKNIAGSYNKSISLFHKIIAVENDEEKWIEALKEAGDDFFVQQNVEFRLGKDIKNKRLWKLYIAYLKDYNPTIMLHTYSKYCRFWIDDIEMRIEYEKQVKIHGSIEVPWTNLFTPSEEISVLQRMKFVIFGTRPPQFQPKPFEINSDHFFGMLCDYDLRKQNCNRFQQIISKTVTKRPLEIFYSKNGMIYQEFPYCSTIINFILKNANANILQKLFKSCKEFYSRQPTPVCYKLTLQDKCNPLKSCTKFQESLIIGDENPSNIYNGKKIVIRNRLFVSAENSQQILSNFIPLIHRCDAKFIEIYRQKLTVEEFEFLTKNGTVEELILIDVSIIDKNERYLYLEDILEMVVKSLRMLEISNTNLYTSQTARALTELPFKNKIQRLYLWEINAELDPNDFAKFVEKNAATNCKLKLHFARNEFKRDFIKIINETIAKKWTHPYFYPICIPEKPHVLFTPVERAPFHQMDPTWPYGVTTTT